MPNFTLPQPAQLLSRPPRRLGKTLLQGAGVILLGYFLLRLQPALAWRELRQANVYWLLAGVGVSWIAILLRSCRLWLLAPQGFPQSAAFRAVAIGYFFTLVAPAGGGEIAKGLLLAKAGNLPKERAFLLVGADRLFDLLGLAIIFSLIFITVVVPSQMLFRLTLLGLAAGALITMILLLGRHEAALRSRSERWSKHPKIIWQKAGSWLAHALDQAACLRNARIVLSAIGLQLLITSMECFGMALLIQAFPFAPPLSSALALRLGGFALVGFALPLLPGGLGTFQAACVLALRPWGVLESQAITFSLAAQSINLASVLIVGALSLRGAGLTFKGSVASRGS